MPTVMMPPTVNTPCPCCGRAGVFTARPHGVLLELARCPSCGADRAARDAEADEQAELDAAECSECSGPAEYQREDLSWECHACREFRLHEVVIDPPDVEPAKPLPTLPSYASLMIFGDRTPAA